MKERTTMARIGGICGFLFVAIPIPCIVTGRPGSLESNSSAHEMRRYFSDGQVAFLFGNGVSFIFAALFFL